MDEIKTNESTVTISYEELKNLLTQSIQYKLEAKFTAELQDRDLQIQALTEQCTEKDSRNSESWWEKYKAEQELKRVKKYIEERGLTHDYEEWEIEEKSQKSA